jgi:hypothetical protein
MEALLQFMEPDPYLHPDSLEMLDPDSMNPDNRIFYLFL